MEKHGWRLVAAAMVACLAGAAPAGAAVVKASIGVSATVVATCRIVPGRPGGCAPSTQTGIAAAPTPQPTVTYSRDPKTGATVETVEF